MIPSRRSIADKVPFPNNTEKVITKIQTTQDIVLCVLSSINISRPYLDNYAYMFEKKNVRDTCENIWKFMKENFSFNPEKGKLQTGRTIRYIIHDPQGVGEKYFDCKHFSSFALSTLLALGIKSNLRLCGYNLRDPFPTHVYVVAYDDDGSEIIIDGTLSFFDMESNSQFHQNIHVLKPISGLVPNRLYTANEVKRYAIR